MTFDQSLAGRVASFNPEPTATADIKAFVSNSMVQREALSAVAAGSGLNEIGFTIDIRASG